MSEQKQKNGKEVVMPGASEYGSEIAKSLWNSVWIRDRSFQ